MATSSKTQESCWGTFRILQDQTGRWQVGALSLWIQRRWNEWRIAHEYTSDPAPWDALVELPAAADDLLHAKHVHRFGMAADHREVTVSAHLADRPYITRPDVSFQVPPGQETTVYVSTPLWVRIALEPGAHLLAELPTVAVQQTWFGPSTVEGHLRYATRTSCRLRQDDLPRRPDRATTAVLIQNHAPTALVLERMEVPTPYLALHRTPDGIHWTEDVTLERTEDGNVAAFRPRGKRPRAASDAVLVSPPREPAPKSGVMRAFGSLFT